MARHLITLGPDESYVIIALAGLRTADNAGSAIGEFLRFYRAHTTGRVLFDLTQSQSALPPETLISVAMQVGRAVSPARVAILTADLDAEQGRLWRRGLDATGHDAMVFDHAGEADAWLRSPAGAERVYIF